MLNPPTTIAGLKSRAKSLKRAEGITHTAALERIAREIGYDSYAAASKGMSL